MVVRKNKALEPKTPTPQPQEHEVLDELDDFDMEEDEEGKIQ